MHLIKKFFIQICILDAEGELCISWLLGSEQSYVGCFYPCISLVGRCLYPVWTLPCYSGLMLAVKWSAVHRYQWAARNGSKGTADAASKVLVKEWQFVISNDLILIRVKSDISATVNSISVTEGSGKCWIVFIWRGWRILFYPLCSKCYRWSNFNPYVAIYLGVSLGCWQAEHACSAMGQGRERLTWEWSIYPKIDHAKSQTKMMMKVHWRGSFLPKHLPIKRRSVPFQALPVKHPQTEAPLSFLPN